jgi:hypothetical protein
MLRDLSPTSGLGWALVLLLAIGLSSAISASTVAAAEDKPSGADSGTEGEGDPSNASVAPDVFPPPPLGVRFAEPIEDGTIRVQYSWERIQSQGMASGTRDISPEFARDQRGFTQTPRSLEVTVHNLQIAYAPHPRVTLLAELPFIRKELERMSLARGRFQDQTEGIGDVMFAVVVPFIRKGFESSQVYIAIDAPTGEFRRGGDDMRLPYDSQLGNGSWDFEWGWTYRGEYERISWGAQGSGRHALNRNSLKYREGSRFVGTVWGAVRIFGGLSASLRTEWAKQNNISGSDRSLLPHFDPSQNAKTRGGERISVAPGLSFDLPMLKGQRIAVEFAIPVHQRLDGPQLERNWSLKTGWQWVY